MCIRTGVRDGCVYVLMYVYLHTCTDIYMQDIGAFCACVCLLGLMTRDWVGFNPPTLRLYVIQCVRFVMRVGNADTVSSRAACDVSLTLAVGHGPQHLQVR